MIHFQFKGVRIPCSSYIPNQQVPGYQDTALNERVCATTGGQPGTDFVDGTTYLRVNYNYLPSHLWRNLGVMIALMVFGCAVYLVASEYISAKKSKGEVLLFRRGAVPEFDEKKEDVEHQPEDRNTVETVLSRQKTVPDAPPSIQKQTAIFHWDEVNYDIKIGKEDRRLLAGVDGWVKPGTLTALMVSSIPRLHMQSNHVLGCFWCW